MDTPGLRAPGELSLGDAVSRVMEAVTFKVTLMGLVWSWCLAVWEVEERDRNEVRAITGCEPDAALVELYRGELRRRREQEAAARRAQAPDRIRRAIWGRHNRATQA